MDGFRERPSETTQPRGGDSGVARNGAARPARSEDKRGWKNTSNVDDELLQKRTIERKERSIVNREVRRIMSIAEDGNPAEALEIVSKCGPDFTESMLSACYSVIIAAYAKKSGSGGRWTEAFHVFNLMKKRGITPTPHAYTSLFNLCTNPPGHFEQAKQLYDSARAKSVLFNTITYNAMIKVCCVCGNLPMALTVFADMKNQKPTTRPSLAVAAETGEEREEDDTPAKRGLRVGDVVSADDWESARATLDRKHVEVPDDVLIPAPKPVDSTPDVITYSFVIRSCLPSNDVMTALRVLEEAENSGLELDSQLYSNMLQVVARWFGLIDTPAKRDASSGDSKSDIYYSIAKAALDIWDRMRDRNITPTPHTFDALLRIVPFTPGFSEQRLDDLVKHIEGSLDVDGRLHTAILTAYASRGSVDRVSAKLKEMIAKNVVLDSHTSLAVVNGFCIANRPVQALELLESTSMPLSVHGISRLLSALMWHSSRGGTQSSSERARAQARKIELAIVQTIKLLKKNNLEVNDVIQLVIARGLSKTWTTDELVKGITDVLGEAVMEQILHARQKNSAGAFKGSR